MASITIMPGHKNLIFAAEIANQTGATFEESESGWITISDTPRLTIPRYCYNQAFDPDGQLERQGDSHLDNAWRALLLNKDGYLIHFDESEIVISDDLPKEKRPGFLLRFPSQAEKEASEEWAAQLGYPSLTEYILEAISRFNQEWEKQPKP